MAKYLALSGGGPKGAGIPGALIVLDYFGKIASCAEGTDQAGYLRDIKGLACSSIGAIIGALWVSFFQNTNMTQ
jgi:predicted acylesterase/phospholipase RssA